MEKVTPQQWFQRLQGTMDTLLRVLGEVIATHPQKDAILTSLSFRTEPAPGQQDAPSEQLLGEEEAVQSVVAYVRAAEARAAALAADSTGPSH